MQQQGRKLNPSKMRIPLVRVVDDEPAEPEEPLVDKLDRLLDVKDSAEAAVARIRVIFKRQVQLFVFFLLWPIIASFMIYGGPSRMHSVGNFLMTMGWFGVIGTGISTAIFWGCVGDQKRGINVLENEAREARKEYAKELNKQ